MFQSDPQPSWLTSQVKILDAVSTSDHKTVHESQLELKLKLNSIIRPCEAVDRYVFT